MIEFRTNGKWGMLILLAIALVFGLNAALPTSEAASATNYYGKAAPVSVQAANPNAMPEATQILNYLANLPNGSDNRVISGQYAGHAGGGWYKYDLYVTALQAQTGQWVGIIERDYGSCEELGWDYTAANETLISHWNGGGLVSINWHVHNPWTGGSYRDMTGASNLRECITPGTAAYTRWLQYLDAIAEYLAELRDAGVVVFWRPFHEMNGGWFWWGAGSAFDFKAVWQHMFDYFTNTKGLNNLLWVYAPDDGYGGEKPGLYFYPGDAYVDIVGIDKYTGSGSSIELRQYEEMLSTGKPLGLTEFGPGGGSWDYTNLINEIRNKYPKIVFFCPWDEGYAIINNSNGTALLNDPWVINRDEIDWQENIPTPTPGPSPTPQPTSTPTPVPPTPTPNPNELILDNTDPGFSTSSSQDAWQEYTEAGGQHYGDTHYYNRQTGTGQDTATWSFTVPRPGRYEAYVWWWEGDWRPTDVPFIVNHLGGSTTIRVNQQINGGQWNLLGTFDFQDQGSVVLSDDVSSGRDVVADAVKLVYIGPLPPATPWVIYLPVVAD